MRILVTGSRGMLGKEFIEYLKKSDDVKGLDIDVKGLDIYESDFNIDIVDYDKLDNMFKEFKPKIVIHCAALINVDYCETHPIEAHNVNVVGTANISKLCDHYKSKMVYISSSMVFTGNRLTPYNEFDLPGPINNYSLTKYMGELNVISGLIVRTNIIGKDKGFFKWVIDNIPNGVNMYRDLYFNTLYIKDFIEAVMNMIRDNKVGIWHITSRNKISKYKFGKLVQRIFGIKGIVKPINYKSVIPRPKNAVLDCSNYEKLYGKLPTVKETLERIKKELI